MRHQQHFTASLCSAVTWLLRRGQSRSLHGSVLCHDHATWIHSGVDVHDLRCRSQPLQHRIHYTTRAKQTLSTYHLQAWATFKVSSREQQPWTVSPVFNNGPETRSWTHDAAAHS